MSDREELMRRAAALDEQAAGAVQEERRRLSQEAAKLRVKALGPKSYPVLICSSCFKLTGWLGSDDRCDTCIDRALRHAAYSDPDRGWVNLTFELKAKPPPPGPAAWKRAAALVGWRRPRDQHVNVTWNKYVDPAETGPPQPDEGFEVAAAERAEAAAPEGNNLLVRFYMSRLRFEQNTWRPVVRKAGPDPLTPDVFAASLPIEQLAEAWGDYREEIAAFNRGVWSAEEERRERARQADEELLAARREQLGTSDLLD